MSPEVSLLFLLVLLCQLHQVPIAVGLADRRLDKMSDRILDTMPKKAVRICILQVFMSVYICVFAMVGIAGSKVIETIYLYM